MTYAKKTLSEIKLIHGDYGNFIKGQKLPKDKEKKYKTPPYRDLAASNEIDGETLNEKCWPGYEKKGMKTMFGKRYPNWVKKKKTRKEEYSDWRSDFSQIDEKAVSQQQQKFFGMVRATQKGEMDNPSDEVKKAAASMTKSDVKKYASTKHDKLPKKIEEKLDSEDKPFVKKLVGKLRKGSKTHAKQADDLEKAMKENTAIESELVIQDWNVDDIKFTEIETVDIIKPKPLKESHSDWKNDLVELDEKFQFLKHAFGKNIIIGTGASKVLGKNPILSFKGAKNAATNKAMKALEKFRNMVSPSKFPKDASRTITKTTDNIITIDPSKMGTRTPRVIKKKNPPKNLGDHYDWRADLGEDWQKVNRKDKTDGMSQKAVNAYKRENPGSKLKTAVTTKPSKLKKGSKASKRRKSFCARSDGQRKMHNIDCKKTPNKRICKARRRWNC